MHLKRLAKLDLRTLEAVQVDLLCKHIILIKIWRSCWVVHTKIYYERKRKFGLNAYEVWNFKIRFLGINIECSASALCNFNVAQQSRNNMQIKMWITNDHLNYYETTKGDTVYLVLSKWWNSWKSLHESTLEHILKYRL